MTIQERAEQAVDLKNSGRCNCAQAVTAALADATPLTIEQLNQITAGFCAGMGTMEATCGSLIGAGIIAGLRSEGNNTLKLTRRMITAFKEKCGAVTCRELKSAINGKPLCPCEECVRNAVLICGDILEL